MTQQISALLRKKQSILDNVNSYYHTVSVQTKHVREIKFIFRINLDIWYTYHDELRFNECQFRKDLADCDNEINRIVNSINSSATKYDTYFVRSLAAQDYEFRSQIAQLKREVERNLKETEEKTSVPARLSIIEQIEKQNQTAKASLEAQKSALSKQELEEMEQVTSKVIESSEKLRAAFVAEFYNKPGAHLVLSQIMQKGFDVGELAYIAIKAVDIELLQFALQYGAELDHYSVDGKTLIYHALKTQNEAIITKAFTETAQFGCTLALAISEGDIATLDKVLENKPALLYSLIGDYTLLQHAVSQAQEETAKYLVTKDATLVTMHNKNGDTVLKTALISDCSDSMLAILLPHLNMEIEYAKLALNIEDKSLANKALERHLISEEYIDQFENELETIVTDELGANSKAHDVVDLI